MNKAIAILTIFLSSFCLPINAKDYYASRFGIASNGTTLNTRSIQKAIDYISENGGGRLIFRVGRYLTGSIYMKSNVTIELSAHTDYRGSAAYNERLSQRRAESVVNYLIEHGIAQDRLSPVGYGKMKPKVIKRKLTEKYDWLKEGDVLTEEFIRALDDEEKQEICNQLNRRTEFTVLRTTYGITEAIKNQKTD